MPRVTKFEKKLIEMLESDDPYYTYREIIQATGASPNTITKYAKIYRQRITFDSEYVEMLESVIRCYMKHGWSKYKQKVKNYLRGLCYE